MSDLVKRLNRAEDVDQYPRDQLSDLCCEAVEEIERLTAENQRYSEEAAQSFPLNKLHEERAKVERLTAKRDSIIVRLPIPRWDVPPPHLEFQRRPARLRQAPAPRAL